MSQNTSITQDRCNCRDWVLPSSQGLLCIHCSVSAPEGRWTGRPAATLSADFLNLFLFLPVFKKMHKLQWKSIMSKMCEDEPKIPQNCSLNQKKKPTNLLLLRLLLWWWCLVLEPERDLSFFLLSRLRDRDRRLSLLLLWCRLKALSQVEIKLILDQLFK